jgi:hypothetical protein
MILKKIQTRELLQEDLVKITLDSKEVYKVLEVQDTPSHTELLLKDNYTQSIDGLRITKDRFNKATIYLVEKGA